MGGIHGLPARDVSLHGATEFLQFINLSIAKSENGTTGFYRTPQSSVWRAGAGVALEVEHSSEVSSDSNHESGCHANSGGAAADDILYRRALAAFGGASGSAAAHHGGNYRHYGELGPGDHRASFGEISYSIRDAG